MLEWSLYSVFLFGLLSGLHCLGMCGGIVGALAMVRPGESVPWRFHFGYNFGRIISYTLAGSLAGAVGESALFAGNILPVQKVLYLAASLLLILVGLYLANLSHWVVRLERAGTFLWKRLQPLTGRFLPVRRVDQAVALGALWGWLPCGLVYSMLVLALATASWRTGALTMLAFGLGTLPNLLLMGLLAGKLQRLLGKPWLRLAAGMVVAGFGISGLVNLWMNGA